VKEAHPTDGWRMGSNDQAGIAFAQPLEKSDRDAIAHKCCSALEITMPLVVDGIDDAVGHAYSGMPDRLYVIDTAGKVAYKSGRGPFGFKPGEMEQALAMLLLDVASRAKPAPTPATPQAIPEKPRVSLLSNEDAWRKLPPLTEGESQPLPAWALALAAALPRTTAAMLELDALHREHNPLGPVLRGKLRWIAAHANHCDYAEAYAAADLRRAGLNDAAVESLKGDHAQLPEKERAALAFAHKLTLAADTVTDNEVARLISWYGEKDVAAMVLLLAHANFQDRLFLTLGVSVEKGGPLKPLAGHFAKTGDYKAPPRPAPVDVGLAPARTDDVPGWSPLDFADLQKNMESQRERKGRISVPSWDDVRKELPVPPANPVRIKWSLVCLGYQPKLALGWSACTRAFAEEAAQDRVFEESLFWVVTRSLDCFY
jgi:alkylhydroperoxidase family enzyme